MIEMLGTYKIIKLILSCRYDLIHFFELVLIYDTNMIIEGHISMVILMYYR